MGLKIEFQGDSVTDCGRVTCGGAGFANGGLGPGYPGMIGARLWCDKPEKEYEFVNRGISGNRVVDLYARWKIDTLNLKPDVLSILIGVNDTWHEFGEGHNGVEVPRYDRIYRELIQWTLDTLPGIRIILLEPFIGTSENIAMMIEDVRKRQTVVRKIAEDFKLEFLPCQSILDNACKRAPMTHWLADGVHPTSAGHQLLADAWLAMTGL